MQKLILKNDLWLRFGCFLTGYNFNILNESSEASKKYVKKITSALVIIITIWSFVGYLFASRYAGAGLITGIIAAMFAGIIVVQIERQIILGNNVNKKTILFRFFLGIIVAIIGALILDQVFFKNDIAKKKEDLLDKRINERVGLVKTNYENNVNEYQHNIDSLRVLMSANDEIAKREGYRIKTGATQKVDQQQQQSSLNQPVINTTTTTSTSFSVHPKIAENQALANRISEYESYIRIEKDSLLNRINSAKERARLEPPGFLDELTIIVELATQSMVALFAYLTFFLFFIFIELFVVLAKLNDGDNDYHKLIKYQEQIREARLKALENKRTAMLGEDDRIDITSSLLLNRPK